MRDDVSNPCLDGVTRWDLPEEVNQLRWLPGLPGEGIDAEGEHIARSMWVCQCTVGYAKERFCRVLAWVRGHRQREVYLLVAVQPEDLENQMLQRHVALPA